MASKQKKGHLQRIVTHKMVGKGTANTIHYRLQKTATHTRQSAGDPDLKTAFAKIVTKETVPQTELEKWIHDRNPLLKPEMIHHVVSALTDAILEHLKAGRPVNLKDQFSFGVAFEGRVDPARPFDVRHLPLSPWVRFSRPFLDKLNAKVRVAYNEPFLPPAVNVANIDVHPQYIQLTGKFRHPELLSADLLSPTDEVIPCEISLSRSPASHTIVTTLMLYPKYPTPPTFAGATLQLQWLDGADEPQFLHLPL